MKYSNVDSKQIFEYQFFATWLEYSSWLAYSIISSCDERRTVHVRALFIQELCVRAYIARYWFIEVV